MGVKNSRKTIENLIDCSKWAESTYHVSGDVARFNSRDDDNFSQVYVATLVALFAKFLALIT